MEEEKKRNGEKEEEEEEEENVVSGCHAILTGALSGVKMCTRCGVTRTPLWRNGPKGPKTLCNACGVRLNRQANKKNVQKRREAANAATTTSAQGWLANNKPKSLKRKREVTVKKTTSYGYFAETATKKTTTKTATTSRTSRGRQTRNEKEKKPQASDASAKKKRRIITNVKRQTSRGGGGVGGQSNTLTKSNGHRNQRRHHHPRDVFIARKEQCQRKRSDAVRSQQQQQQQQQQQRADLFLRWAVMTTQTMDAAAANDDDDNGSDVIAVRLLRTMTDRCVIEKGSVRLPLGHVEDANGTVLMMADEMMMMMMMATTTTARRITITENLALEFESVDACKACVQRIVAARDDMHRDRDLQQQQQQEQEEEEEATMMVVEGEEEEEEEGEEEEEADAKRTSDATDVIPIPSVRVVEDYDTTGNIGGSFEMPKDGYIRCPTHDVLEKPGCANYELTDRDREWLRGLNETMREFHEKLNSEKFDQKKDTECWRVITESQLERIFDVFDEGCASLGRRIDASMAAVLCQRREFGKPCPLVAAACFAWWEKHRGENERYLGGAFFRPPPDAEYRPDLRKSSLWTICAADVANGEIKRRKTKINSSLAAARRKVGKKRRRRRAGGTGRRPVAVKTARNALPSAAPATPAPVAGAAEAADIPTPIEEEAVDAAVV